MIAIFPELTACVEARDIERLAVLVRIYFGGADARRPRLKVEEVIKDFGLELEIRHSKNYVGVTLLKDSKLSLIHI